MENLAREWHMVDERRSAMRCKWFTSRFTRKSQQVDNAADFRQREPLDHPELSHMTMRELADLPMPAYTLESCTSDVRIV
jgi:hypothetical protein